MARHFGTERTTGRDDIDPLPAADDCGDMPDAFGSCFYDLSVEQRLKAVLETIPWNTPNAPLTPLQELALKIHGDVCTYQLLHPAVTLTSPEDQAHYLTTLLNKYVSTSCVSHAYEVFLDMLILGVLTVSSDRRVLLSDRWQASFLRFVIEQMPNTIRQQLAANKKMRWTMALHLTSFLWIKYTDDRQPRRSTADSLASEILRQTAPDRRRATPLTDKLSRLSARSKRHHG